MWLQHSICEGNHGNRCWEAELASRYGSSYLGEGCCLRVLCARSRLGPGCRVGSRCLATVLCGGAGCPRALAGPCWIRSSRLTSSRVREGKVPECLGWAGTLPDAVSLKGLDESFSSRGDPDPVLLSLPLSEETSEIQIHMKFPDFDS